MNDTAVVTGSDLDRLAERVERAAALITDLRSKHGQLEGRHAQLEDTHAQLTARHSELEGKHGKLATEHGELSGTHQKVTTELAQLQARHTQLEQEHQTLLKNVQDTQGKLQGQDPTALLAEVAALKKEQREWLNERKEVASRIEAISAKLERIE